MSDYDLDGDGGKDAFLREAFPLTHGRTTVINPNTWEKAAASALKTIASTDSLELARLHVSDMDPTVNVKQELDPWGGLYADPSAYWDRRRFLTIGHLAYNWATLRDEEMVTHLASKQRDYGHGNILRFGTQGILVRISDKLERIANLAKRGLTPANESLADSYNDLLGYCVIGLMLVDGTFESPLAEDAA